VQPPLDPEPERPRAVAVIGWTWLVLGVLAFLKDVLDLIVWITIRPAISSLFGAATEQTPQARILRPLFAHLGELKAAQALLALLIVFTAIAFLRCRPWGRVGMQIACVLALLYILCFGVLWSMSFVRGMTAAGVPMLASSRIALGAGLSFLALLAAAFVAMLATLASSGFRDAYRKAAG